ncbi:MAG: tetratricopeptide repeat protein [Gammaproteobacteria bacterium]|nr:tetratricopeptide repeat protein [Gammaproteobacteria bacterium]
METDEEQVEKLKKWWQENGRSVVAGVIIGVGGLFGYRYWVEYQTEIAEQASAHFSDMVEALEASKIAQASDQAEILIAEFSGTEYAIMARFALARTFVEAGEFGKAAEQLQQIVGTTDNQALGYLARKRLAAVQLQMSQPEKALSTLAIEFPEQFSAAVEELKGDIYTAQGKSGEAADAYRKALRGSPGPADSKFLQQKLDDLGVTG